ncbi:hypothetical protein MKW98_005040 [Papaver atlanticum]|uniref:Uncharacterized protein n=1 Tax=Papaver atlanticum TaxID=357466 RepID=A0AAD4TFV8_9MAGN|nr:hypothetical protein MKW98_005040 [Papaver atlanticum]
MRIWLVDRMVQEIDAVKTKLEVCIASEFQKNQGCLAMRIVQQSELFSFTFGVAYIGRHSCADLFSMLLLHMGASPPRLDGIPDTRRWSLGKDGVFSVIILYGKLIADAAVNDFPFNFIWKPKIPPKVSFFIGPFYDLAKCWPSVNQFNYGSESLSDNSGVGLGLASPTRLWPSTLSYDSSLPGFTFYFLAPSILRHHIAGRAKCDQQYLGFVMLQQYLLVKFKDTVLKSGCSCLLDPHVPRGSIR